MIRATTNQLLDRSTHPAIHVGGHHWSAYHVCGITGFISAVVLACVLVMHLDLSVGIILALAGAGVITFLALAMLTKVITGKESLIYYHHEIAILAVSTGVLWLWGKPVLPYLDIVILGIGTFLAFGRIGCLMVGCCHGIPHRWGVCYRQEHADEGFTPYYVGVRLFPIQAVESLYVFVVVCVGVVLAWTDAPGEALAWYVITYDIGRFSFEFLRGDPERPYYCGLSEGQWISLALMLVVVWAELTGRLGFHAWHLLATAALILVAMVVVALQRRRGGARFRMLNPRHVRELIETVESLDEEELDGDDVPEGIHVGCTSLGIQVSISRFKRAAGSAMHYALSSRNKPMTPSAARTIADVICRIRHPHMSNELIEGERGVFHVVVGAKQG